MSNVIKFPERHNFPAPVSEAQPDNSAKDDGPKRKPFFAGLLRFVWVVTVLVWPVLKWVLSIEVFFQFVRMLYHWNTPGVYAGWTFALHFAVLTMITYFVSVHKPKGL
jgi:hypothetical protein